MKPLQLQPCRYDELPTNPDFVAGRAVATTTSQGGNSMLILTNGYNHNDGPTGTRVAAESSEYVFVYVISIGTPIRRQFIQVSNPFNGIAWNPNNREFYVFGGINDNVHVYALQVGAWTEQTGVALSDNNFGIGVRPITDGMAVTQDGKRLLVANMENDSASVIDLNTRTEIAELDLRPGKKVAAQSVEPGGSSPFCVAIKGNTKAYITNTL